MAGNEYRMIRVEALLKKYKVADIIRSQFTRFYESDSISLAAEHLKSGLERSFLVFDKWQNLRGILTEQKIMDTVKQNGAEDLIEAHLSNKYHMLLPGDDLAYVLSKMQQEKHRLMPVFENGRLIGVIDDDMIKHFLQMQEKLKK